jgi:hypothetical protein
MRCGETWSRACGETLIDMRRAAAAEFFKWLASGGVHLLCSGVAGRRAGSEAGCMCQGARSQITRQGARMATPHCDPYMSVVARGGCSSCLCMHAVMTRTPPNTPPPPPPPPPPSSSDVHRVIVRTSLCPVESHCQQQSVFFVLTTR